MTFISAPQDFFGSTCKCSDGGMHLFFLLCDLAKLVLKYLVSKFWNCVCCFVLHVQFYVIIADFAFSFFPFKVQLFACFSLLFMGLWLFIEQLGLCLSHTEVVGTDISRLKDIIL